MSGKAVVFPTDFSELSLKALPLARRMAAVLDAELHCVYSVEEPHIYATLDMGPVTIPTAEELASSAETRLQGFVKDHVSDQSVKTAVLTGSPAEQIASYASSVDADMIVMTTHGHSGVRHVILGSTTEAVLRHASCPVLSVRAD